MARNFSAKMIQILHERLFRRLKFVIYLIIFMAWADYMLKHMKFFLGYLPRTLIVMIVRWIWRKIKSTTILNFWTMTSGCADSKRTHVRTRACVVYITRPGAELWPYKMHQSSSPKALKIDFLLPLSALSDQQTLKKMKTFLISMLILSLKI